MRLASGHFFGGSWTRAVTSTRRPPTKRVSIGEPLLLRAERRNQCRKYRNSNNKGGLERGARVPNNTGEKEETDPTASVREHLETMLTCWQAFDDEKWQKRWNLFNYSPLSAQQFLPRKKRKLAKWVSERVQSCQNGWGRPFIVNLLHSSLQSLISTETTAVRTLDWWWEKHFSCPRGANCFTVDSLKWPDSENNCPNAWDRYELQLFRLFYANYWVRSSS